MFKDAWNGEACALRTKLILGNLAEKGAYLPLSKQSKYINKHDKMIEVVQQHVITWESVFQMNRYIEELQPPNAYAKVTRSDT